MRGIRRSQTEDGPWIGWRTALLGSVLLVCLTFVSTYRFTVGAFPWGRPSMVSLTALRRQPGFRSLERALTLIATRYVSAPDMSEVYAAAIQGAVASLHDPYSAYLDPQGMIDLRMTTTGQYVGIGVRLERTTGGQYVIEQVFADGPAARATPVGGSRAIGLRPGDRLVAINGVSLQGQTPSFLFAHLLGPSGSTLTLQIRRPGTGDGTLRTFTVERGPVVVRTVRSRMLSDGIGYLEITAFNSATPTEVTQALTSLRAQGLRALVLDLRNNPGGLMSAAVGVAGHFVPRGLVSYLVTRSGARIDYMVHSGTPLALPLAVLINGDTASAAEALAGAIQDDRTGILIGVPSYGKGVAQSIFPLGDGAGLKLTVARFYTPLGRSIQGRGLVPTVYIAFPNPTSSSLGNPATDPQLAEAIHFLQGRRSAG